MEVWVENDKVEMAKQKIAEKEAQLDRIEAMLIALTAKKKPKARTAKKHEYPLFFENLWCEYPKVSGANKRKAYAQFCQRIKEGIHSEDMLAGTVSYDALCKATDRTVMLPATFFGRDKHFNCDWTIPKKKPTEDPNKQHHPDFDPDADTTIGLDPVNPYEDM